MERKYKSEYKIADVLEADYPNIKHYGVRNGEEYIDCPFCGRKKKVNVSYVKNVFRFQRVTFPTLCNPFL